MNNFCLRSTKKIITFLTVLMVVHPFYTVSAFYPTQRARPESQESVLGVANTNLNEESPQSPQNFFVTSTDRKGNELNKSAWYLPGDISGFDAYISEDGLLIQPINIKENWNISFKPSFLQRTDQEKKYFDSASFNDIKNIRNKVIVDRGLLEEKYENTKSGVKQTFVVNESQQGEGNLEFVIHYDTGLIVKSQTRNNLVWGDANNNLFEYKEIKSWDSNGKVLDLEVKIDIEESLIYFIIQDGDASYPITIDPIGTTPVWTTEGSQTQEFFGNDMTTVGDVNGDGYDDFGVVAQNYSDGETQEGYAALYLGGASGPSSTPDWGSSSNIAYQRYGCSILPAGDFNGDDYADFIVQACPDELNGNTNPDTYYFYIGSDSSISTTPATSLSGTSSFTPIDIYTMGDVNGDQMSDTMVFWEDPDTFDRFVSIYMGNPSALFPNPELDNDDFTYQLPSDIASIKPAGDIDGDGRIDLIAINNSTTVLIYYGGDSTFVEEYQIDIPDLLSVEFSARIMPLGDVSGDGYADFGVSRNHFDVGAGRDIGSVQLFLGDPNRPAISWVEIENPDTASDYLGFGNYFRSVGDVNGDGLSDILIADQSNSNGPMTNGYIGAIYIYYGTDAVAQDYEYDFLLRGNHGDHFFGIGASAGDVNGDGISDLILGSPNYDSSNPAPDDRTGNIMLFYGKADGPSETPGLTLSGDADDARLGEVNPAYGDFNADGYKDLALVNNSNQIRVLRGSENGFEPNNNMLIETGNPDSVFTSMASLGDTNGDGLEDFGVIRIDNPNEPGKTIRVQVFLGQNSTEIINPEPRELDEYENLVNPIISGKGDVDGNGYMDLILGDPDFSSGRGLVLIYFSLFDGVSFIPGWEVQGTEDGERFGTSVDISGDSNGDGYNDILVGAPYYTPGGNPVTPEGRIYVFDGNPNTVLDTPSWNYIGDQTSRPYTGKIVSFAGDVNGDGYSEVISSVDTQDDGGVTEENAFILFYGDSDGISSSPSWTIDDTLGLTNDSKATSIGDVNGDGYGDILVASPYYSDIGIQGKAMVFFGNSTIPLTTPDWQSFGSGTNTLFGFHILGVEDANSDGFSDFIITAPDVSDGFTNNGKVYVYYGNNASNLYSDIKPVAKQLKVNTSSLIPYGGIGDSLNSFRLTVSAMLPVGRTSARLCFEIKKNNQAFDMTGLVCENLSNTGQLSNPQVYEKLISGLEEAEAYKWRVRFQYLPDMTYSNWYVAPGNFSLRTPTTVQFETDSFTVSESAGTLDANIVVGKEFTSNIIVGYNVIGGTAEPGVDYVLNNNPTPVGITIVDAGNPFRGLPIEVIQDNIYNGGSKDLTIEILSPQTALLGTRTTYTLTILDDDDPPSVEINADVNSRTEGGSLITVTATLSSISGLDTIINLNLDGSAQVGEDYNISSTTITIPAGSLSGSITIAPLSDLLINEISEDIIITIGSVIGGDIGLNDEVTIEILNVVPVPSVTLTSNKAQINENNDSASITATLSNQFNQDVTINLNFSGTATQGSDYQSTSSVILIPQGSLTGSINITTINDALFENNENIIVGIFSATNANVLTPQIVNITLVDDEFPATTLTQTPLSTPTESMSPTPTSTVSITVTPTSEQKSTQITNFIFITPVEGQVIQDNRLSQVSLSLLSPDGLNDKSIIIEINGIKYNSKDDTGFNIERVGEEYKIIFNREILLPSEKESVLTVYFVDSANITYSKTIRFNAPKQKSDQSVGIFGIASIIATLPLGVWALSFLASPLILSFLIPLIVALLTPASKKKSKVISKDTSSPITFALIRITNIFTGETIKTVSDFSGKFAAELSKGKYKVSVNHSGFKEYISNLEIDSESAELQMEFYLEPDLNKDMSTISQFKVFNLRIIPLSVIASSVLSFINLIYTPSTISIIIFTVMIILVSVYLIALKLNLKNALNH